jgi:hypothetical protein
VWVEFKPKYRRWRVVTSDDGKASLSILTVRLVTCDRLAIPTQIDLNGLWERGSAVTDAGQAFFSFLFNRDFEQFPPNAQRALATLLEGIMREQAGIMAHDHFVYVVRPLSERR